MPKRVKTQPMPENAGAPRKRVDGRPTLHDVAQRAGVSAKTVSRVVNDAPYVSPDTLSRVQEAITALGFRPNMTARSLRLGTAPPSIGLVIEDLANPFYSTIARAVEGIARARGHMVFVGSSEEDPGDERQLVNALLRRHVSGLILVPASDDHTYLLPEFEAGTHVVFLDRPPGKIKSDVVLLDDVGGARQAVTHLLEQGHRRIGIVGDAPSLYTARKRAEGYRRVLADWKIPADAELERLTSHGVESAEQATDALLSLSNPPTAIFATNNRNCIGVLRTVRGRKSTVAVVGFDDFELAELVTPAVTVITYDAAEMGRRGAELLFDRLDGDSRPPRSVRIRTRLVTRGSGEVALRQRA